MRQRFPGEMPGNPVQHSTVVRVLPGRARRASDDVGISISHTMPAFSFPKERRTRDATRVCGTRRLGALARRELPTLHAVRRLKTSITVLFSG
jgi:hypothetical protein